MLHGMFYIALGRTHGNAKAHGDFGMRTTLDAVQNKGMPVQLRQFIQPFAKPLKCFVCLRMALRRKMVVRQIVNVCFRLNITLAGFSPTRWRSTAILDAVVNRKARGLRMVSGLGTCDRRKNDSCMMSSTFCSLGQRPRIKALTSWACFRKRLCRNLCLGSDIGCAKQD